jgi:tripartite-type tricarboxylate transporter receptor subunit TctC
MMRCQPMVSTIFPSFGAFERSARAVALAAVLATTAQAQTPAEFYKGKTIEVYIGTSAGGGYDAYSRILSRHMGRHLPGNPVLVPKNMTGGGGIRLADFLYNAAPGAGRRHADWQHQ